MARRLIRQQSTVHSSSSAEPCSWWRSPRSNLWFGTDQAAALPKRNWKVRLKQEWETLTGVRVEPKPPRHTVDERW